MRFDYAIGNPPYQDSTIGDNSTYAPPVYNRFLDEAYKVADKVEMIHPARFLFKAGSTPKQWNVKMLNDPHFKIKLYEENSSQIFANTEIKGGVAVSYHDTTKIFGAIDIFTPYEQLNQILHKVKNTPDFKSFTSIVVTSYAYHFTDKMHSDYPDAKGLMSTGHENDLKSNVFEKLPHILHKEKPNDNDEYIRILGRENNERSYRYIKREYINDVCNLFKHKIFLSGATGRGDFGETLTLPIISEPGVGSTETFLSIGSFETHEEANAVCKYIQTKFARCMLSIMKKTQANTPKKWKYVPLQDFTTNSDIDWSKSIPEIDKQLYKKYGLSDEEINFIETHVKPME